MRELLEGDILQPPFSVGNKQRRNYIYPTERLQTMNKCRSWPSYDHVEVGFD